MLNRCSSLGIKLAYILLPTIVVTNYYLFYHNSIYTITDDRDKILIDEFADTPIFEELVLDATDSNNNGESIEISPSSSSSNNVSRKKKARNKRNTYRNRPSCTSPVKTKWIFESCSNNSDDDMISHSRASNNTCNLCSHTTDPFLIFMNKLRIKMEDLKKEECGRLVLYTVAFGSKYTKSFRPIYPRLVQQYQKFHNRCFFTFVLYDSNAVNKEYNDKDHVHIMSSKDGLDQMIMIPEDILPYENHRRNTKIFKMVGHVIFPWADYLIWQDAKFRMVSFCF